MSEPAATTDDARARTLRVALLASLAAAPAFVLAADGGLLAVGAWLALVAPACGFGVGASLGFGRRGALALFVTGSCGVAALVWGARGAATDPGPISLAWTSWILASAAVLGWGAGTFFVRAGSRFAEAGASALATIFLLGFGLALLPLHEPLRAPGSILTPASLSSWLDASPWTVAAESLDIDWMRHPAVYGPAATEWYSDTRRPYPSAAGEGGLLTSLTAAGTKALAAPLMLLVGCALGASGRRATSREVRP